MSLSWRLSNISRYSIGKAVDDLELLLKRLGVRQFHLYGQSFGGILAYELVKRMAESDKEAPYKVLSMILSSTPTDVKRVEGEAQRLIDTLLKVDNDETKVGERFRLAHTCQTPEMPQPLINAYAHAGAVWRGTTAIPNYVAAPPTFSSGTSTLPPTMVLRGEHDFVTEVCVQEWKTNIPTRIRFKTLSGCAHHGLLEKGSTYGDMIDSFCGEYD
jgi:pimeloyl-ACP methyl ester carboxylesterase